MLKVQRRLAAQILKCGENRVRFDPSRLDESKQKGPGSRKGKKTARTHSKRRWINKIRLQRGYIKSLRDSQKIISADYHELYMKSKGGFFRSLRHLKLYVEERGFVKK